MQRKPTVAARSLRCIVGGGVVALGLATAAQAGFEICNETDLTQSVAIGYKGDTDWTSEGWWVVEPGACVQPVSGNLTKRYYYYHAVSEGGTFRGQDYLFCTQSSEFTIVGDTDCGGRGYEASDFREVDTGETATSYTLTLVQTGADSAPVSTAAKGPGGVGSIALAGAATSTGSDVVITDGGGTQNVTDAPVLPSVETAVEDGALQSDLAAGQHGEPFRTAAFFQGCELDGGRPICGFHADGLKMRVFYNGPTPDDLMYALEDMTVNTPVMLEGDRVEVAGLQAAIVVRGVQPRRGAGDPYSSLRRAIQGNWVASGDSKSVITIRGSEIYVRYDGEFRATRFLRLADRCDGLRGDGPVLIQTALSDQRPACYTVAKADKSGLDLQPVGGGNIIRFRRAR